jgi:hypothetical protein
MSDATYVEVVDEIVRATRAERDTVCGEVKGAILARVGSHLPDFDVDGFLDEASGHLEPYVVFKVDASDEATSRTLPIAEARAIDPGVALGDELLFQFLCRGEAMSDLGTPDVMRRAIARGAFAAIPALYADALDERR